MKQVIKRNHKHETFDIRKIYASIYAACLSVHMPGPAAEQAAEAVSKDIKQWIETKAEVSTNDIRSLASKKLQQINHHAGLVYGNNRIIW